MTNGTVPFCLPSGPPEHIHGVLIFSQQITTYLSDLFLRNNNLKVFRISVNKIEHLCVHLYIYLTFIPGTPRCLPHLIKLKQQHSPEMCAATKRKLSLLFQAVLLCFITEIDRIQVKREEVDHETNKTFAKEQQEKEVESDQQQQVSELARAPQELELEEKQRQTTERQASDSESCQQRVCDLSPTLITAQTALERKKEQRQTVEQVIGVIGDGTAVVTFNDEEGWLIIKCKHLLQERFQ